MPAPHPADPAAEDYRRQHQLLDKCVLGVWRDESIEALRRYFHEDGPPDTLYSGRRFDRLTGGGDTPAVRDTITPADLLALTFLSITDRLPALTVDTTETHADQITNLLAQIPSDLPMHAAPWQFYAPESPAAGLWALLCRCGGHHRPVTASKLLARKRPHLLPVYDSKVANLLDQPSNIWACLWTWFHDDPRRQEALTTMRDETGSITDISLLRCLDVILWMRATRSNR
ncbi:DUF6308 family protein [Amycolatopsis pigmentata]|uniref:DUF6308 family protein n=1 Tax=Amycolatopsis pigmentata TaxID=450801 RepID=A0ABW5G5K0_9PSEU